jgi:ABC-type ATPase with predicted acetyltransferase domain
VKSFEDTGKISERSASLMRMFGLTADRIKEFKRIVNCGIDIEPGDIVFVTGASGSGKSVLLEELKKQIDKRQIVAVDKIRLSKTKRLIDCIGDSLVPAMRCLNTAGLNDCLCMLNTPSNLSTGQKWRYRLAAAVSKDKKWIFSDEFCSNLDRITAAVISGSVRKYADRTGKTFILASSNDDILPNLQPDVIVRTEFNAQSDVIYKTRQRQRKAELKCT